VPKKEIRILARLSADKLASSNGSTMSDQLQGCEGTRHFLCAYCRSAQVRFG
jgi:hypothetical protein